MSTYLLIRTDAFEATGTGHFVRCTALIQEWQSRGGHAVVVSSSLFPWLVEKLRLMGVEFVEISSRPGSAEDAAETSAIAQSRKISWVVVDGYQFDGDFQSHLTERGLRQIFVDDYGHCESYSADFVLNQNQGAQSSLYPKTASTTRLLLGPRFALLRPEQYDRWRSWTRETPSVAKKILVTFGGLDPRHMVLRSIRAAARIARPELEWLFITGGANSDYPAIVKAGEALKSLKHNVRIEKNLDSISDWMAWADLAVTAGGSTCWELVFMGLPMIIVTTVPNQDGIGSTLESSGAAVHLGWPEQATEERIAIEISKLALDASTRESMSRVGRTLVDGYGPKRVIDLIKGEANV